MLNKNIYSEAGNDIKRGVFVWRDWVDSRDDSTLLWPASINCPYCNHILAKSEGIEEKRKGLGINPMDDFSHNLFSCRFCGWIRQKWVSWHRGMPGVTSDRWDTQRAMRRFELSDPRLALSELGAHMRRRFSDISFISPRRFEELIAAAFAEHGWETQLTGRSSDGGVDIYLYSRLNGDKAIVECKRYKGKVGIGIVDRLLGVQLAIGVPKAFLVTASEFSSQAMQRMASPNIARSGFSLSLINAAQLLTMLEVFRENLPPLELSRILRC